MDEHGGGNGHPHDHFPWYTNEGKRAGLRGFLTSTNHKRIGILYLVPILSFFTVAVILGVLMRIQMLSPDSKFLTGTRYNEMFTLHGIIMIFLVVIPGHPDDLRQLLPPHPHRREGHGVPAAEPLHLVPVHPGGRHPAGVPAHRQGPGGHRLDLLRSLQPAHHGERAAGRLRRVHPGDVLHPHGAQHRHHGPHGTRPGDDVLPAAPFRLGHLRHRVGPGPGHPGHRHHDGPDPHRADLRHRGLRPLQGR